MSTRKLSDPEPAYGAMLAALRAADLPTSDLHEAGAHYYVLGDDDAFGGIAISGDVALLRSMIVPGKRNSGMGSALLGELLAAARAQGASEVWLLTTSAEPFFAKHGFEQMPRDSAPEAIAASAQFKNLCPASAALMRLRLL